MIQSETRTVPSGLRVFSLSAGYADRRVLNSITLELPAGKISVLTGPCGSGKTTFVRALLSDPPRPGFWQEGDIVRPLETRQGVQRQGIQRQSMQPQGRSGRKLGSVLVPKTTSEECISAEAREVLKLHWPTDSAVYEELEPFLDTPIEELALWRYRLASFTRAINVAAEFYIFDEPDADLPVSIIDMIAERILALGHHATVLLVTHHLGLAKQVADYAILMVDGEIVEAAEGSKFFNDPNHPRTRRFVKMGH